MKPNPFSDLKLTGVVEKSTIGPDQRLFAPTPDPKGESTSAPPRPRASVPPSEGTRPRASANVPDTPNAPSSGRASANSREAMPGRAMPRSVGRHSHDIFQDQIRWLNRLKLELSERYDVPVTGNAMVQLAVDMLRADYIGKGEQSQLIRVLIDEQPWPSSPQLSPERGEEDGR